MQENLEKIRTDALGEIGAATDESALEAVRVKYLGRTGIVSRVSEGMKSLTKEERPVVGRLLNEVRTAVTSAIESRSGELSTQKDLAAIAGVDISLPGTPAPIGCLHPLIQLQDRAIQILRRMGFALADGPDIDTEWYCFDALNTPPDHPARNETDTFYLPDGRLLRTQTSTVQVRTMQQHPPPVRIIAPGAAYRRDETDATHAAQFNQLEGLYVDEDVSLADLKGTCEFFIKELFGQDTPLRFRPHFFPFTEPSLEIDVKLGDKWLEVAGCGMVDPAVFDKINEARGDNAYDPEKYTGFAFGFGVDRLAMILLGVNDIRLFTENDLRFLKQFTS